MDCQIAAERTGGTYVCTRDAGHKGPCAARPVTEVVIDDLKFKLLQAQQVMAALVRMYGIKTEDGTYIDIPAEQVEATFYKPLGVSYLLDRQVLRLAARN